MVRLYEAREGVSAARPHGHQPDPLISPKSEWTLDRMDRMDEMDHKDQPDLLWSKFMQTVSVLQTIFD